MTSMGIISYLQEVLSWEMHGSRLSETSGLQLTYQVRHMLHDESIYGPDTDKFLPERFLAPGMKDPTVAFGFGRR
jgi:hypothetical protein